ncbi:MAG: HAMP domain-containing sensor histidine kinase, partial [Rhodothermales bacterium]|nr:HAMP domain-containing sensor histidine kinase [Rhodothermales bacterium]
ERVINERLNEANDQLQIANVRLQEAVTLKDEFLATTSHELRTPITAILGYASILRDEIPGEYHEFVDIIEKSGERLMSTLNALLDLAKLRAGTMDVNIEEVDIGRLLARVVESRRLDANAKGLDLQFRIETSKPLARTDAYAVRRIAENLLDNALKFTDEGSVTIVVGGGADTIEIGFTDTGVGIDVEFLPILFDEFRQESGGLARTHSGNGLGLAIANRLADLVNGSISVESTKTIGSTFTVVVPRDTVISSGESGEPRSESILARDRDPVRPGDDATDLVRKASQTESAADSP